MKRKLRSIPQSIQPLAVSPEFDHDPAAWLATHAANLKMRWMLAHADDGVIWGKFADGKLQLSTDVFPHVSPRLRTVTLQQVRLFGDRAELLVWRDVAGWRARLITEEDGAPVEVFDEAHLLWGTRVEQLKDGFSLVREGIEGLRHAPPLTMNANADGTLPCRLALTVRHTIGYDEDGQARIVLSRLASLGAAQS